MKTNESSGMLMGSFRHIPVKESAKSEALDNDDVRTEPTGLFGSIFITTINWNY